MALQDYLIRFLLRRNIVSDLPGRLRLYFPHYHQLPPKAFPYLSYIQEVLLLWPGVEEVRVNGRIGSILIHYNPAHTSRDNIMGWINRVIEVGMALAREIDWTQEPPEAMIRNMAKQRLQQYLPHGHGGKEVNHALCNAPGKNKHGV